MSCVVSWGKIVKYGKHLSLSYGCTRNVSCWGQGGSNPPYRAGLLPGSAVTRVTAGPPDNNPALQGRLLSVFAL